MTLVEFRETTFSKTMDAVKESKHHAKKLKLALCDLEDALCEYYEAEHNGEETDYEYDQDYREDSDENWDVDKDYKNPNMRMRNSSNGMSSMRMRRSYGNRRGRYNY